MTRYFLLFLLLLIAPGLLLAQTEAEKFEALKRFDQQYIQQMQQQDKLKQQLEQQQQAQPPVNTQKPVVTSPSPTPQPLPQTTPAAPSKPLTLEDVQKKKSPPPISGFKKNENSDENQSSKPSGWRYGF